MPLKYRCIALCRNQELRLFDWTRAVAKPSVASLLVCRLMLGFLYEDQMGVPVTEVRGLGNDRLGVEVTFSAGVLVAGWATIGSGACIGSGARIREDLTIGSVALVGMGSVVINDVPPNTTWAGVPACQLGA